MTLHQAETFTVLAADDDPDILELVAFTLGRAGHEVTTAGDGEQALQLALAGDFDVVVLDVRMPKMNGYEVVRHLREHEATRGLSAMLLSASVQDDQVAQGFDAGADDYLRKPFSPREFLSRVEALVHG